MRRRILVATLAVAAAAFVLFAIPLAVAVRNLVIADELDELERLATRVEQNVGAASLQGADAIEFPRTDAGVRLGFYDANGIRRAGAVPLHLEPALQGARQGRVVQHRGKRLAVAVPVTRNERVMGILFADTSGSQVTGRVGRYWLLIGASAAAAFGIAALLARSQARRIAAPLGRLADAARRVGAGDFTTPAPRAGIDEIDAIASALDAAATRIDGALTRERQFSADASHQLRTPLTALRVALENAQLDGGGPHLESAITQTERLDATIEELLALARDTHSGPEPVPVGPLLDDLREQWHGRLAAAGRPLRIAIDDDTDSLHATPTAVRQVLDVLVGNAEEHGRGAITVRARSVRGGVAIDVSDEGPGVVDDPAEIFRRRSAKEGRRGIGLALARSLAEAEGGRLVLSHAGPRPVFTVVLTSQPTADDHGGLL
ncbi:MAG: integral rane sensor signal transduction histidine kinase [Actinomycetia bacterium]|nr:integral rane sensor signal transduction histidine kinase [Actinomycetes bacterium]